MRILHVIETLGRGGAEQLLVTLLPALQRRGHLCELAVLWSPYDLAPELEEAGVPVHRLGIRHRWQLAQGILKLLPLFDKGFDIVHSHLSFAGLHCSLASYLKSPPLRVATFHNCDWDSYPARSLAHRLRKVSEGYLLRSRADLLLAISPAVAESYRRHLGVGEVTVIPNAVDARALGQVDTAREALRQRFGVPDSSFLITVPGRLVHEKGHRYLLQALVLLKGRPFAPVVLVVGDGPLRERIVAEGGALGVSAQLALHPALPHGELMQLMKSSDLVVVPSTHEGFGMVALEAMALGTAVVATAVGGLAGLIEDGVSGVLVPAADPEALAEAVWELARDQEKRNSLAEQGRLRALTRFDIETVVVALEQAYLGKLQQPEPRPRSAGWYQ
jgi:glycosyltransferase involved in cell wall biosynthesis